MEPKSIPACRTLLKISGVLMILFGVLCTLIYCLGLAGFAALNYATGGIFSVRSDLIGMALLLAAGIAELICGILGVRAAKRPERAGKGRLVWGVLCLLLSILSIGSIIVRNAGIPLWEPLTALILAAVVPIVYLVSTAGLLSLPPEEDPEEAAEEPAESEAPEA